MRFVSIYLLKGRLINIRYLHLIFICYIKCRQCVVQSRFHVQIVCKHIFDSGSCNIVCLIKRKHYLKCSPLAILSNATTFASLQFSVQCTRDKEGTNYSVMYLSRICCWLSKMVVTLKVREDFCFMLIDGYKFMLM